MILETIPICEVMFRFSAAEDIVAQETIPVLGWSLETLSDVS